ncbi:MAG: ABC transporter substrate-binding protein [Burkholderiaceae bacterium]|nr:ABC transporter substrate-binding protein [Burkholderiaceae bacterium]
MNARTALYRAAALACGLALTHAASAETLKIGVIAAFSGPGAAWGNSVLGAARMLAEDVNAAGGLPVGGKKYTVEIISYDDKYKAQDGLTAMNRLVFDDKVKIVVGPMGAAPALAAVPVANENKVLMMTLAWTDRVMSPNLKYTFRTGVPSQVFAGAQIRWVVGKLGVSRVGAMFPNDATGQDAAAVFDGAYEAAGAKLVAKEYFERERVDFVPLLTRVLAQNIDAFELDGNPPDTAGLIVKQLRELGFKGPIIATSADGVTEIVRIAGKSAADNLYVHQPFNRTAPALVSFAKRYTERYNAPMNGTAPIVHAGMQVLFEALKKAGTVTDTDKLREALLASEGAETLLGRAHWIGQAKWGSNQQLFTPVYVGVLKNGELSIAATCSADKCE